MIVTFAASRSQSDVFVWARTRPQAVQNIPSTIAAASATKVFRFFIGHTPSLFLDGTGSKAVLIGGVYAGARKSIIARDEKDTNSFRISSSALGDVVFTVSSETTSGAAFVCQWSCRVRRSHCVGCRTRDSEERRKRGRRCGRNGLCARGDASGGRQPWRRRIHDDLSRR